MIRPVVEFFQLNPVLSKQEKNYELFPSGKDDPIYNIGLRKALEATIGVYVFFDSRGQGVYAGQASKSLWWESRSTFNKELGTNPTRKVSLVAHNQRSEYKPWKEKRLQIHPRPVKIRDLSVYFSAYEVPKDQIDDIEALLIRVCRNSMINLTSPHFGKYESKRKRMTESL